MNARHGGFLAVLLWTTLSSCARGSRSPSEPAADDDGDETGCEVDSTCGTDDAADPCFGPDEACEGWGESRTGLVETPEGWLTLDGEAHARRTLWPSSSQSGEIYRIDAESLEISGAFFTGPNHFDTFSDAPSRTAVDDEGNVVIANRAIRGDGLASITKIAANALECPDRDGNGRVDTSSGYGDLLAFDGHDDFRDECILWHAIVGEEAGAVARAVVLTREMALDGVLLQRGWVGLWGERAFEEFDPETGERTGRRAETPGLRPYGAAVDRDGWVWATHQDVVRVPIAGRFDSADPEDSFEIVALPENADAKRVLVDENDVPWVSGWDVWRLDRDTFEWEAVGLGTAVEFPQIGGIASDGEGSIWAGTNSSGERVYRIENDEDLGYHVVETPGVATFGMAVDFTGHAWAFGYHLGVAARIDVETEAVEILLDDCPGPCLSFPYVRGDITGLQRHNALDPAGTWRQVLEGCPGGGTDWATLTIDAGTPVGTSIVVSVRGSDTLATLPSASFMRLGDVPHDGNVFVLDVPADTEVLEIQAVLRSEDRVVSPVLRSVTVARECPERID